jgi:hypothetical protein
MAVTETIPGRPNYLEWGPIFAGAIVAAALSFLLLTFGGAIGLSLTSPWPNTGAKLWVVALALAWWMVLVQIGSFAAGVILLAECDPVGSIPAPRRGPSETAHMA